MRLHTSIKHILVISTAAFFLIAGTLLVAAQDATVASDVACHPALESLWTTASEACIGKPEGYICNGGSAPQAEPAGQLSNALSSVGALVDVQAVDGLRTTAFTAEGTSGGVAWMRPADFVSMTTLIIGDVYLRDVTPPDFPPWQSLVVETDNQPSACTAAPKNTFVAQSLDGQSTRVVINGVSLDLNGTVAVQTQDSQSIFILLSGSLRVLALGQVQSLLAGQQVSVPHNPGDFTFPAGPPNPPQFLDSASIQNFPVGLLDQPIMLPQPGFVSTQGAVNVRSAPSTEASVLFQVPAGSNMTVLGRNSAGDWYHVQFSTGETGWMFAELLIKQVGDIQAVYEATPLPPQRYGKLALAAQINAPMGVNLRSAPDVGFGVVTTLPFGQEVQLVARSPYSPWVKVDANGVLGWVALLTLETNAVIDALPIDNSVPPPPAPTQVPGTFGNAFPDPNGPSH